MTVFSCTLYCTTLELWFILFWSLLVIVSWKQEDSNRNSCQLANSLNCFNTVVMVLIGRIWFLISKSKLGSTVEFWHTPGSPSLGIIIWSGTLDISETTHSDWLICSSRKHRCSSHRRDWNFLGGFSKTITWNFQRGGVVEKVLICRGGMDILWDYARPSWALLFFHKRNSIMGLILLTWPWTSLQYPLLSPLTWSSMCAT